MEHTDKAPSLEEIDAWFRTRGGTDFSYLKGHYARFCHTHEFVSQRLPRGSKIADIGAHWLHQAFLFAKDGYAVSAFDVPSTMTMPHVQAQADELGIDLNLIGNLEVAEGLKQKETSSFDAILFCEIIEHITFNPIRMWTEMFRIVRPGGKIFVTTPNSMHHETLRERLLQLEKDFAYGIPLDEIFNTGTYGHHWKEFSLAEIRRYFDKFAPSLKITDFAAFSDRLEDEERWRHEVYFADQRPALFDMNQVVSLVEQSGGMPFHRQFFYEVTVSPNKEPITIKPPW